MLEEHVQRRLAAIVAADVVGYSRLMEANEERTLDALKQHRREFFDPTITNHGGRIFKVMGDGFLVEFGSVLNAARCAVEIQRGMLERNAGVPEDRHIKFRIGINLGDIIVDGDDFYGDGVNMAARLEGLAGPGGIACSAIVRHQLGNKLELEFIDQGEQSVKNIAQRVHVYFVNWAQTTPTAASQGAAGDAAPVRPDKPSVAVLPFFNISNDPEQEFFSDGITEDIITDLSKVSGLFVLGRNTVFTYKGKAVHLERMAKELGVAYVVEGSVRKAGQKVRINAQLVDGRTGGHIWAERYDGDLSDIFALQDEITLKIVGALKVKLLPEENKAIKAVPTESVEAYTYCLRGREFLNMHYTRYYPLARNMFAKAVELDPSFAEAYAGIADCDSYSFLTRKSLTTITSMLDISAKAIELNPNLAAAHASRGLACWGAERPSEAEAEYMKALELDPNLYEANYFYGRYCRAMGHLSRAAELFERAAEVRPVDYKSVGLLQSVYELLGREDAAANSGRRCVERAERELQSRPENAVAAMHAAMALAAMGEKVRSKQFLLLAMSIEADDPAMLFNGACVYSRLGEVEPALDLLEKVHPLIPSAEQAWTATDPDLVPLRASPRFQALLASVGAELEAN
jgi:adenylate cyclase